MATIACVCLLGQEAGGQTAAQIARQRFDVDAMHSTIAFAATIIGAVKVRGRFTSYEGSIVCDTLHPERSSVSVVINATSLTTDMTFRDDHLRSPDFFDTKTYPTIEFTSDRVTPIRGGARVRGSLTMHGVTRHIAFPARMLLSPRTTGGGNLSTAFSAELRLSRRDFGIAGDNKFNPSYNPVTNMLSDSVDILLELDAQHESYTSRRLGIGSPPGASDTINQVLRARGVAAAIDTYKALMTETPVRFRFTAGQLDVIGHQLAERGELRDAVTILSANAELYGDVPGVLESLGETLALANDTPGAIDVYQRALAQFPRSASAREMTRRLAHLNTTRP